MLYLWFAHFQQLPVLNVIDEIAYITSREISCYLIRNIKSNQIKSGLFQATISIKVKRKSTKTTETTTETAKKDRQTDRHNKHTTYNTLKLPNTKYMLDQLIVMHVYTTVKSNLCIMDHSVKGW